VTGRSLEGGEVRRIRYEKGALRLTGGDKLFRREKKQGGEKLVVRGGNVCRRVCIMGDAA